jgi:hypothetical protein
MLRKDDKPACNQSTLTHRNQLGYTMRRIPAGFIPAHATIQPVSSARKPVIVRKLTREWNAGYASADLHGDEVELELLDGTGKLLRINWNQIKWVCFVRELGPTSVSEADTVNPERLLRRKFSSRPRINGLWLRITLSDGEELEGIAPNDRSLIDSGGLLLTPPDTRSNTQRVFVPRSAIRELTIVGVIGPASVGRGPVAENRTRQQPGLFEGSDE